VGTKQIAWTAAIALVVVLGYQHVQASKGAGVSSLRKSQA
jgi:hypothetical protein